MKKLTPKEEEIKELLYKGLSINEIAEQLFLAPCTVATHRDNILKKCEVKNVRELLSQRISELECKIRFIRDYMGDNI